MKSRMLVFSMFLGLVAIVLAGCSVGFSKRDNNGLENGLNIGNDKLPDSWTSILPNPPGDFVASAVVRDLPVVTTENVSIEDISKFVEEAKSFGFVSQLDANLGDNIAVSLLNESENLSLNVAGIVGGRAVFTVIKTNTDTGNETNTTN